jgi:hypothetical protein
MGLFGGSTTSTQTTDSKSTNQLNYDPTLASEWNSVLGTAGGLSDWLVNHPPPQAQVAGPTDLTGQYWQRAQDAAQGPVLSDVQGAYGDVYNRVAGMGQDPSQINLPQNFNFAPGALNFDNPWAAGVPSVSAPGGVSGLASSYRVDPVTSERISAERINAPGAIDPIQAAQLMRVMGPQLQQYQMDPRALQQVNAPNLRDFQMQAAANVAPSGLASAQNWTDPGVAQQYMSPYMQDVVDTQKKKANEDYLQQLEGQRSQAVAAGAYGGSRQAVQEATGARDLQLQLAQIQAAGLQGAYQQGQQQFNQQQQLGMQGQQFNIGTNLQAQLANQQAQQQANVQNLSSFLQTQGLGAQTGLQAALANQGAGLQVGGQNLAAQLQTQGLGANLGQQAQLANQAQQMQMAMANQQAQEFGHQQQLQASLANQQTGLQAGMANQQTGLQAGLSNQQAALAGQQMGLQGAMFGSQQQMQAGLSNQQARQQALSQQYAGNLQGGLQTQQMGMQGQIAGGQLGLQGAQAQEALRQAQQGINFNTAMGAGTTLGQMANTTLGGYQAGLAGLGQLGQAAMGQQGMAQQQQDTRYANEMAGMMTPLQAQAYLASLLAMSPQSYSTTGTQQGTTSLRQPGPGTFQQVAGGLLAAAGVASGLGAFSGGGAVASNPGGWGYPGG